LCRDASVADQHVPPVRELSLICCFDALILHLNCEMVDEEKVQESMDLEI